MTKKRHFLHHYLFFIPEVVVTALADFGGEDVGLVNHPAKLATASNIVVWVVLMFIIAHSHMEAESNILVECKSEVEFIKNPYGARAVSLDMWHSRTVAEFVQQGADSDIANSVLVYHRALLEIDLHLYRNQECLPGMLGKSARIFVMPTARKGEELVLLHKANHPLDIRACRISQATNNTLLNRRNSQPGMPHSLHIDNDLPSR